MKGKLKRIKGHFRKGHDSILKGKKVTFSAKYKDLKRTYIRLPRKTFDKFKSVPRSIKQFTANDERPKYCESPVLLRPRKESLILDPTNKQSDNNKR